MRSHPQELDTSRTSINSSQRGTTDGGSLPAAGFIAVVTGGAGAIGGAIAEALRAAGHEVLILDRDGDVSCDLGDASQVRRAADRILSDHGRCDLLIHAAASFDRVTLDTFDVARFRGVQAVNVEAMLLLAQAFTPGMRERRYGRIISIVSNTFWSPPGEDRLAYVASRDR